MSRLNPLISNFISVKFLSRGLTGRDVNKIASSVGAAVGQYLSMPNLVSCTFTGLAGPISNISSIKVNGLVSKTLEGMMLVNAGPLTGRDLPKLIGGVSEGLVMALRTMMLTGNAAGVGVGSGMGFFYNVNDKVFSRILSLELRKSGLTGRDIDNMGSCISKGLIQFLKTTVNFSVIATGAVVPATPPISIAGIPSVFTSIN